MRIPRIYINQEIKLNTIISLPKETALHLATVLKRKLGSNIILFNNQLDQNNQYGEYLAKIIAAEKNNLTIEILEYEPKNTGSSISINIELAQCISKPNHFEVSLQKSVELGVNIITPIISQRSEQILNTHNLEKKISRWQKIIINACEQSGRTDVPILNQPININQWVEQQNKLNNVSNKLLLGLCTKTNNTLHNLNIDYKKINAFKIIIGPEGGLSDLEANLLAKNNFNLIKLGSRILRTETAGLVIISILQFMSNNF